MSLPAGVASQAVAIVGIRGSGKTNTAGVIAEELLDQGQPIVVIDPTDAWWGLRSAYPIYVLGGDHGDLPLDEQSGHVVAECIVRDQASLVLSVRHLRKGAQRRFVTDLCEELYHLKGKDAYRTPLTVIIDEAPLFVPQKVLGEVARTVGAVEDLIARGRNTGFGVVLISQRPATLNKDVLTQADTIISHRLTGPQDRKALAAWFEENATLEQQREVLGSLATLENGHAWVWAPSLSVFTRTAVRKRRTYDSSSTPTGASPSTAPKRLTPVDLSALQARLAEVLAEAQANDVGALRRKLAAADAALADARAASQAVAVATPQVPPWVDALPSFLRAIRALHPALTRVTEEIAALEAEACRLVTDLAATVPLDWPRASDSSPTVSPVTNPPAARRRPDPPAPRRSATDGAATPSSALGRGERLVLTACVQYIRDGVTREHLTVLTGYKRSSRDTFLQRLRERGLIEASGDRWRASPAGVRAAGSDVPTLPTGAALRRYWEDRLTGGEQRIFAALTAAGAHGLTREALDAHTGYKRSSRDTFVQRLRTRELVTVDGGRVAASAHLFA